MAGEALSQPQAQMYRFGGRRNTFAMSGTDLRAGAALFTRAGTSLAAQHFRKVRKLLLRSKR